jgi:hypothetical protein
LHLRVTLEVQLTQPPHEQVTQDFRQGAQ